MIILVQFLSTVVLMSHYFSMVWWDEDFGLENDLPSFKKKLLNKKNLKLGDHTSTLRVNVAGG